MPISSVRKPDKPPVPKANLKYDGLDFAQGTLNGEYMKNVQVKKPEKSRKTQDNLKSDQGSMNTDSTARDAYKPLLVERPKKAMPSSGNLKVGRSRSVDSGFSGDSTSSSDYKQGFTTVRPQKVCTTTMYLLIPRSNPTSARPFIMTFKGQQQISFYKIISYFR